MCIRKKKGGEPFKNKRFDERKINDRPKYDLDSIYGRCIEEMTLQQAKRDQIITIFLAMFSFIVPFALSSTQFNLFTKGLVFLAISIIGFGFSLVIVRYRVYKEAYWICCQALTNLMNFKEGELDKKTIQSVYYRCLKKKGDKYVNKKKKKFKHYKFFKENVFSGETIHCLIHSFIVSVLFGLGTLLAAGSNIIWGLAAGLIAFIWQTHVYFKNLTEIYSVLVDGTSTSFNKAFSKAWFLHLYVEKQEPEEDEDDC